MVGSPETHVGVFSFSLGSDISFSVLGVGMLSNDEREINREKKTFNLAVVSSKRQKLKIFHASSLNSRKKKSLFHFASRPTKIRMEEGERLKRRTRE